MVNLLPRIFPRASSDPRADYEKSLLRYEAEVGGMLFGAVPKGHKRQFFCLDERTWVWHEEWTENGQRRVVTTRYDIRPTGVIKAQDGQPRQPISKNEAHNLLNAIQLYCRHINSAYQQMLTSS